MSQPSGTQAALKKKRRKKEKQPESSENSTKMKPNVRGSAKV